MTEDIGTTPCAFGGALTSRVGPFLTWDTFTAGDTVVEVFATSEAGEAIKMVAPDLGYRGAALQEDNFEVATSPTSSHQEDRYYGRFAVKPGVAVTGGTDATKIVVQNAGDVPVASTRFRSRPAGPSPSRTRRSRSRRSPHAAPGEPHRDDRRVRLHGGHVVRVDGAGGRRRDQPARRPELTFTAPAGQYEFCLVAIGETGRSAPLAVPVRATVADVVTARAGAAQTVQRGTDVTLNGAPSIGAETYQWEQIANVDGQTFAPVSLSSTTAAKPTFSLPQMELPVAPGPNPTYTAVAATPLRFRLTVTGNGMADTAETVVRPQVETLAVTDARYRTRGEWRVSGTSELQAGQRVTVVPGSRVNASGPPTLASARGNVLGYASVETLGAWSHRGAGPDPRTSGTTTVTAVSTLGGRTMTNITVTS